MNERRIPFQGVANFRDLGGYPTRSGTRVGWGLVFRSGALDQLSVENLERFKELGIRTVLDLRSDVECAERPCPVDARRHSITGRPPPSGLSPRTAEDGERRLLDVYRGLLDHGAADIGSLIRIVACADALPAVISCHAGKDRTGLVSAVLLEALGVEREVVLEDYELTTRYLLQSHQTSTFERLLASGYSEAAAVAVLGTSMSAMTGALQHLDERYGGVVGYLTTEAGLSDDDLNRLRELILEPAG